MNFQLFIIITMRSIIGQLLRFKALRKTIFSFNIHNNTSSFMRKSKLYLEKTYYKFSTEKKNLIDKKNQSKSIHVMCKQLQINEQQSSTYRLIQQQKVNSLNSQLITLIEQQIRFIHLHQHEVNKYLKKLNYPQNLKEELEIVIKLISTFSQNIVTLNLYELNSKCAILQYLHRSLLQKPKQEKLLARLAQIIESEIKVRETLSYFKSYNCQSNIINTHPNKYPQAWKNIHLLIYSNQKTMSEGYNTFSNTLYQIGATIMFMEQISKISFELELYLQYFKSSWRSLYNLLLFKNPTIQNGRKILNFFEQPLRKIVEMSYDSIITNKFIYIPANGNFQGKINLFIQTKDSIPVRVLYHKQLPILKETTQNSNQIDYIEDILVHIHGGGFVALSSHSTQNHTRKWANELKIPIFSIDYRMAPDHVYPQAHFDCFQVYKFLTTQLYKYIKIRPINVFIAGDSVGGNLSCAITTLALKNQLIIPKAMYLAYPLIDMALFKYYPSKKYVIDNPFIWPTIIKKFMTSYFKNEQDMNSPLASPILVTEQFIGGNPKDHSFPKQWPTTYIAVGTKDPVRDDSLLFMQKMTESNINCKCFLYEHMGHSFLSTEQIIKDTAKTITHSIELLKELVASNKTKEK